MRALRALGQGMPPCSLVRPDAEQPAFEQKGERLFLRGLPVPLPDRLANVIELEVEGTPAPFPLAPYRADR